METKDDRMAYLLKEYYEKIYVYCFNILRNAHDAEDAVQEVFIKALQNNKLLHIENYSAWLYKIAYHHCLNKIKRQSIIKFISFENTSMIQDVSNNPSMDMELDEIMAQLKAKERALLVLRIIEDKDFAEIALIFNITPATARKRFERVKLKVQKIIERSSYDEK